jgi:hypothetical protein
MYLWVTLQLLDVCVVHRYVLPVYVVAGVRRRDLSSFFVPEFCFFPALDTSPFAMERSKEVLHACTMDQSTYKEL